MRKEKMPVSEVLRRIAIVLCVVVFLCCGVYIGIFIYESVQNGQSNKLAFEQYVSVEGSGINKEGIVITPVGSESVEEQVIERLSVDFNALRGVNADVCGWIQVSGLEKINYPVVWCSNHDYYLDHSWDRQSTRYGSIFLDEANSPDFQDAYTIIYGHNMKDGSMFGGLKKYRNPSFFEEHGGYITIYLPDAVYIYRVFSVRHVLADAKSVYTLGFVNGDSFNSYVQYMKQDSMYNTGVSVNGNDKVISLSTCAGDDRLILHAKLVAIGETNY